MFKEETIEALLFEEESTTIDFKSEQYRFENEDDKTKSELLKDILAFTNSWRRTDAYILIGVRDVQGGQGEVIGVNSHIDDAKLQQFVNSKTQKAIIFSYVAAKYKGKDIGIIQIPKQERPIYLLKDYGKVQKNTVYIRRGSSTEIATPVEVARMGVDDSRVESGDPRLDVRFYQSSHDRIIGQDLELNSNIITITDAIPDYRMTARTGMGISVDLTLPTINKDYWRDWVHYASFSMSVNPVELAITNTDTISANSPCLELIIDDPERSLILYDSTEEPKEPSTDIMTKIGSLRREESIYRIEYKESGYWKLTADIEHVHPKRTVPVPDRIFMGSKTTKKYLIKVTVFASNITKPHEGFLGLSIKANPILLLWSDFYKSVLKRS
ncbi:MAG: ATP-binding protein [Thermodesulfobacteriota bacterium]|nr:MAG: ATP-binding protein [Thermodesulfobacteriota bacterium]